MYILFCAVYLEDPGGPRSSSLQHAISNTQHVSVVDKGCDQGDVRGSTPRLQQTWSPVLCLAPNGIQDQVKSWGEKEGPSLITEDSL